MKKTIAILFLIGMVLGFGAEVRAERGEEAAPPPSREEREKVRQRIETLRMWRLTKALDLDEKTSAQLFPLLNRFDKRRADTEASMREEMKALREALKENREGTLKDILNRLEQDRLNLHRIQDEERAEVKKILTLRQQAQFVLFMHEFGMEMRRIAAEARERRHGRDAGMPGREAPSER